MPVRPDRPRSLVLVVALAAIAAACGDEPPRRRRDPAQERANRMLREAAACEGGPIAGRASSCRAACQLGHSNSCHDAGALCEAAGDAAAALALYDRACDGGSGLGCDAAGRARRTGAPRPADLAEAERRERMARFYLRVHCEHRHARSCLALGRIYDTTRGGPADDRAAASFLAEACRLGQAEACPSVQ